MRSFLQTREWAEFQKSLGREVFEYDENSISALIVKHRLLLGRSYLYIPHGPEFDFNAMTGGFKNPVSSFVVWLRQLAQREEAIFVKAEPVTDNIAQLLAENGFRKSKKEIQPAKTAVINLDKSENELLSAMHHKTRYNIKVAEKHGITVSESEDIEIFWQLMEKTTARDKFSSHPREYYQKLLERLQEGKLCTKLFVARGGGRPGISTSASGSAAGSKTAEVVLPGRPAAAALVLYHGDAGYYLHGASDYSQRALMAPYQLHWAIIKTLRASGFKFYDLWGIDARRWLGVTRFKLGWGGQTVEHPGAFDLTTSGFWHWGYKLFR